MNTEAIERVILPLAEQIQTNRAKLSKYAYIGALITVPLARIIAVAPPSWQGLGMIPFVCLISAIIMRRNAGTERPLSAWKHIGFFAVLTALAFKLILWPLALVTFISLTTWEQLYLRSSRKQSAVGQ